MSLLPTLAADQILPFVPSQINCGKPILRRASMSHVAGLFVNTEGDGVNESESEGSELYLFESDGYSQVLCVTVLVSTIWNIAATEMSNDHRVILRTGTCVLECWSIGLSARGLT